MPRKQDFWAGPCLGRGRGSCHKLLSAGNFLEAKETAKKRRKKKFFSLGKMIKDTSLLGGFLQLLGLRKSKLSHRFGTKGCKEGKGRWDVRVTRGPRKSFSWKTLQNGSQLLKLLPKTFLRSAGDSFGRLGTLPSLGGNNFGNVLDCWGISER